MDSISNFYRERGLDINFHVDHMGRTIINARLGALDVKPDIKNVDMVIKKSLMNYAPFILTNKMDEKERSEYQEMKIFFKLLRGEK